MRLLEATGVEKSYGDRHILKGCDLWVDEGDRVALVGINGSGKSTLLKLLVGEESADHGQIQRMGSLGWLAQDPALPGRTVQDTIDDAVAWHHRLRADYEAATQAHDIDKMARLQDLLDQHGWTLGHRVDAILDRLGAPPRTSLLETLSGGERRRVALARALLGSPDLLVLDEPTNHLDADTIEWLQSFLQAWRGAVLLVTHDRYLLEAVANVIVEVEDGKTLRCDGSYGDYLIERAERKIAEANERDRHANLLAREAEWASRSPAARTVKQKARLQRLDDLKKVPLARAEAEVKLDLRSGVHKGGALLELHGIHKALGGRTLMKDLELVVQPGDRLGILGPNGAGKSTLLRIIQGVLPPDRGSRAVAPRVLVGVLDQARTGLDLDDTVWENAGGGNDHVFVHGRPVHVASFLERFAFGRTSHGQRAKTLSGGERARLLMARLMLKGANLLLLDEPTNDLDLYTLRILEEALLEFDGAAVVVTHDRAFLDRVCTAVLAFEGSSRVVRYASRAQHLDAMARERAAEKAAIEEKAAKEAKNAKPAESRNARPASNKALSFKERAELAALPEQIEALEAELADLHTTLSDPATFKKRAAEIPALQAKAEEMGQRLAERYARWETLESRA
jgi:ATP-binding cassette subfamily F protein uup